MIFAQREMPVWQRVKQPSRPWMPHRHAQKVDSLFLNLNGTYPSLYDDPLVLETGVRGAKHIRQTQWLKGRVSPTTLNLHIDSLQKQHQIREGVNLGLGAAAIMAISGSDFYIARMHMINQTTYDWNNGLSQILVHPIVASLLGFAAIGAISFATHRSNQGHRITRDLLGKLAPEI